MKKPSISTLKKKVWVDMSKYVRLRDADENGFASCCTCGITKHYKQMQAGHFLPGRRNAILFDERGINAQCYGCNCMKQGNSIKYFRFMQNKHGDDVIEELERLNEQSKTFTIEELEKIHKELKEKLEQLMTVRV